MRHKELILLILILVIPILVAHLSLQAQTTAGSSAGKQLYQKHCASCHGADGKGVEKMAKMLKATIKDLNKIANTPEVNKDWQKIISAGKAKMPAFSKKLKEAEVSSVITYIRSLAPASGKTETPAAKDTTKSTK